MRKGAYLYTLHVEITLLLHALESSSHSSASIIRHFQTHLLVNMLST